MTKLGTLVESNVYFYIHCGQDKYKEISTKVEIQAWQDKTDTEKFLKQTKAARHALEDIQTVTTSESTLHMRSTALHDAPRLYSRK